MMIYVVTILIVIVVGLLMTVLARMTEQKIEERSNRDEILNAVRILSSKMESSERRVLEQIISSRNKNFETIRTWIGEFRDGDILEIKNSLRTLLKHIYFKGIEAVNDVPEVIPEVIPEGVSGVVGCSGTHGFAGKDINSSLEIEAVEEVKNIEEQSDYSLDYFDNGSYVVKFSKDKMMWENYHKKFDENQCAPNIEDFSKWYQEYFEAHYDGSDESFDKLMLV